MLGPGGRAAPAGASRCERVMDHSNAVYRSTRVSHAPWSPAAAAATSSMFVASAPTSNDLLSISATSIRHGAESRAAGCPRGHPAAPSRAAHRWPRARAGCSDQDERVALEDRHHLAGL